MDCPLCLSKNIPEFMSFEERAFGERRHRRYLRCKTCMLISLNSVDYLTLEKEKLRYETHENNKLDSFYEKFLRRLWTPMKSYISPSLQGLDYGSGPYPALSEIANNESYKLEAYDPIFGPYQTSRDEYDYLTCSEVIEHFHEPRKELHKWGKLIKSGGVIGVMTQFYRPEVDFVNWDYRRDDTHVGFYNLQTMQWIEQHMNWKIIFSEESVTIFKKN